MGKILNISFCEQKFKFRTDDRLFSPNQLDAGSRLLLETVKIKNPKAKILDIGCGWGAIGIILAKLYPETNVLLLDNDPKAVNISKENFVLNYTKNAQIFKADIHLTNPQRQFDLAVTNPPWAKNISMIPRFIKFAFDHLAHDGDFYLVINQTFKTEKIIKSIFGNCRIMAEKTPYKVLSATKLLEYN